MKCPYCGKVCANEKGVRIHVGRKHSGGGIRDTH